MLAELKLCSHVVPGLESVSSLRTRTKGALLKEAVVLALGKAQLGFVVAGQAFSSFSASFWAEVNGTC